MSLFGGLNGTSHVQDVLRLDDPDIFNELFNATVALVEDETSIATATKAPRLYFGRMTLPAFIAFCIFIPLLFIITAVNCYWDFEYERCAVEPADEKALTARSVTSGNQGSDDASKKSAKVVPTPASTSGAVTIEVDETQCTSPPEDTPLITMDLTQQASEAEITRQKRKKMVAAAYSISTSQSERIHEDGTQESSTSETGVSPSSAWVSADHSKSGRIFVAMKSETNTKTPETRTKTPETKTKTPEAKTKTPEVKNKS
uniref:Uncharacterized protein n=1 Tax=Panagrellus redivivus TaxID=6233 RepID=A0A7E4VBY3_PANRE